MSYFYDRAWDALSAEIKAQACAIFDAAFVSGEKERMLEAYGRHGKIAWFENAFGHFSVGMMVRNELRQGGLMDWAVPTGNLDDYYVQMLEHWMGVR